MSGPQPPHPAALRGLSSDTRAGEWLRAVGTLPESTSAGGARRSRVRARRAAAGGDTALTQITLDVPRAFHWVECAHWSSTERASRCAALQGVLASVFPRDVEGDSGAPHYAQGLHDVAGVLILAIGALRSRQVLRCLVRGPLLRGFARPTLDAPLAILRLLPALLRAVDSRKAAELDPLPANAAFALPWILTWFAHSVSRVTPAVRLYDLFIRAHPLLPLYAAAALVLSPRALVRLRDVRDRAPEDEGEFFAALAALPAALLVTVKDADELAGAATALALAHPPARLLADAPQHDATILCTEWPELWEGLSTHPHPPAGLASEGKRGSRLQGTIVALLAAFVIAVGAVYVQTHMAGLPP